MEYLLGDAAQETTTEPNQSLLPTTIRSASFSSAHVQIWTAGIPSASFVV
jgi:hypothetical protein